MSRLVSIMVALDLRFIQDKAEDGQLVYRLDPSVIHSYSQLSSHILVIGLLMCLSHTMGRERQTSQYQDTPCATWWLLRFAHISPNYHESILNLVYSKLDAAWIARQADVVEKNKGAKLDMFSKTSVLPT